MYNVYNTYNDNYLCGHICNSFLKAILRKFRECVELPLGIAGAAARKLTSRLQRLLGKQTSASGHTMHGAHACLVPVNYHTTNYHTTNVFKQLADNKKADAWMLAIGTGCADPNNSKSVSFAGRASISSSIVREHDILGAQPTHIVTVYVNPHTL